MLAVRAVAVECLLAVLDTQRSDALAHFGRLAEDAGPILGTGYVERFLHYAVFRDYPAVRPTLMGMLESSEPHVVETGARQIAVAALWVEGARGDEVALFDMEERTSEPVLRRYTPTILRNETVGAECDRHLRTLFEDESDLVRNEARQMLGLILNRTKLAARGSLIEAFVHSLVSARHATLLAHRLKDARRPLPAEICALTERALQTFGLQGRINSIRGGWHRGGVGRVDGSASRAEQ